MTFFKKRRLLANLLATVSGKFGTMGIQLLTTMVLARFLAPEDFGIVAMCSIFLSISEMLIDSGMAGSIIYHKDVKDIELHTLFWTNVFISITIYFILFISSGWIASFYGVELLEDIIKIIGLSSVIHSLCLIQSAILSKRLEFKVQSKILIYSAIASSVGTLFFAYFQSGVWTLVVQQILLKVFQALFYLIYGRYTPRFQYSLMALKRHWYFGSRLLGTAFLRLIYDNIYIQVIARVINIRDAGFYAQAKRFNDIPRALITFPLERVIFPALTSSSNMIEKMKKISDVFTLILVPLMFIGSLLSDNMILLLLGEKWIESGWMLSYLFLGTIGISLESLNRNFIKASGKINLLLRFELVKRIVNLGVLGLGLFWSLEGILMAFIVNSVVSWMINCYGLSLALDYSVKNQMKNVILVVLIALLPFVFLKYFLVGQNFNIWIDSLLKIGIYTFLYIVPIYFFKRDEIVKIFEKSRINKE